MIRVNPVWEAGAKIALSAIAFGVFGGFIVGISEVWRQGYLATGFWRLIVLVFGRTINDGLLLGAVFALLGGVPAMVAVMLTKRRIAGWAGAIGSLLSIILVVLVVQRGFQANFASLFPSAYASTPGISPQTVFWVFLPPLVRDIVANAAWQHWKTFAIVGASVLIPSLLIGLSIGLIARKLRPEPSEHEPHWRRWLMISLPVLVLVAMVTNAPGAAQSDESHPDVIVISIDTVRADALGCYGAEPSPTPNLDRFAQSATRFERAYAPAPWTIPSHAGLLTGLADHRHGAITMDTRLTADKLTLAERFAEQGYDTAAFVTSFMLSPRYGFEQGFAHYSMAPEANGEQIVDRALGWLKGRTDKPVFLFVHLFDPHWPYGPPDAALPGGQAGSFHEFVQQVLNGDEPTKKAWRQRYLDEIRRADAAVGRLFMQLESEGRLERSWVIVLSDHGEEWWDHGFLGHAVTLYEEVLRVPLLIKAPGQQNLSVVSDAVSLLDVPVTLAEKLHLPGKVGMDGQDLLRRPVESRKIFASSYIWGTPRFALIRGCEKGINSYFWRFGDFSGEATKAYFDLCADAFEIHNLAATETGQTWLDGLTSYMHEAQVEPTEYYPVLSPEMRVKFKSLGYIE